MPKELIWVKHNESGCPVAEDSVVNVVYRNKQTSYQPMTAKCFNWWIDGSDWDIDSYAVLKP